MRWCAPPPRAARSSPSRRWSTTSPVTRWRSPPSALRQDPVGAQTSWSRPPTSPGGRHQLAHRRRGPLRSGPATYAVELLEHGADNSSPQRRDLTIAAGTSVRHDDILALCSVPTERRGPAHHPVRRSDPRHQPHLQPARRGQPVRSARRRHLRSVPGAGGATRACPRRRAGDAAATCRMIRARSPARAPTWCWSTTRRGPRK